MIITTIGTPDPPKTAGGRDEHRTGESDNQRIVILFREEAAAFSKSSAGMIAYAGMIPTRAWVAG
jgi:hypothetical protein